MTRSRTGQGTDLHVAMIDALAEWMTQPAYFSHYGQERARRTGMKHPSISPYGPFQARDRSVFIVIQNDWEWVAFLPRHPAAGRSGGHPASPPTPTGWRTTTR